MAHVRHLTADSIPRPLKLAGPLRSELERDHRVCLKPIGQRDGRCLRCG